MLTFALLARLEAKLDKVGAVEALLKSASALANEERPCLVCAQARANELRHLRCIRQRSGTRRHLNGPIADALMAKASELLSAPPQIDKVEVLAAKV
jgi:quinol monooxygenase YgiN